MKPDPVTLARDLLRHTLHGPPPLDTTMALAEAVVAMDGDLAALRIEHEAQSAIIDGLRATVSDCQDAHQHLLDTVVSGLNEDVKEARRGRDELRAALRLIRSGAGPHDNWSDEVREGWSRVDAALAGASK